MTEALTLFDRAHAPWSMSANSRNMRCSGAMTLEPLCADETSEAAAWGTCCHAIAERALREDSSVLDRIDEIVDVDGHEFVVDEEMIDCAAVYVDYVRGRAAMAGVLLVEKKMSLAALEPPFVAGGTADAIIVSPIGKNNDVVDIEVVDLKGGKGVVVEALGNSQARGYGLCASLMFKETRVRNVTVTIVQPRAPHGEGPIRSETFGFAELIDWAATLLKSMDVAKVAKSIFPGLGSGVDFDQWAAKHLRTGECGFCAAKGICPAYRNQALAVAGEKALAWFEDPAAAPVVPAPGELSPERAAQVLDGLEALSDWIKAFSGHWHGQAEKGVEIPGWMLVPKAGHRKWSLPERAPAQMRAMGIDSAIFLEPETLRSVSQVEKRLGTKRLDIIKNLWTRPSKGTNLVKRGSTTRTEVKSKAEAFFEKSEETP